MTKAITQIDIEELNNRVLNKCTMCKAGKVKTWTVKRRGGVRLPCLEGQKESW